MTAAILMFLWWLSGTASFIYWWTNDQDFEKSTTLLAAYVGVIGPIAFIVGWFISKPPAGASTVWIKRRNK